MFSFDRLRADECFPFNLDINKLQFLTKSVFLSFSFWSTKPLDLDWIRIPVPYPYRDPDSLEMLDPDPDSMILIFFGVSVNRQREGVISW